MTHPQEAPDISREAVERLAGFCATLDLATESQVASTGAYASAMLLALRAALDAADARE